MSNPVFTIERQGTYSIERVGNEAHVHLHGLVITSDHDHGIETMPPGPHLFIIPFPGETLDKAIERAHQTEIVPGITLDQIKQQAELT